MKRASDSLLGVPSQCFVAGTAGVGRASRGSRAQYTANLALKVNAKVGGCLARLSDQDEAPFMKEPFMVMGADVTHPTGAGWGLLCDQHAINGWQVHVKRLTSDK